MAKPTTKSERKVEPIPQAKRKEWNALIRETQEVVNRHDSSVFDLILLAGRVEKEYGEDKLGRWADEAGVSLTAARQYRWLFNKGVDEAFIKKYARSAGKKNGLTYTAIREVVQFCGSATSPYAIEYLDWAVEHKATAVSLRGYMMEDTAPHLHKEEASKSFKLALQDKQEHEGFSDYVKVELEKIIEERPDLEEKILGTVITSPDDFAALKIAAGLLSDKEQHIVDDAKRYGKKLTAMFRWLKDNERDLTQSISYGHELSEDLKFRLAKLDELAKKIGNTEIKEVHFDESSVLDMEL